VSGLASCIGFLTASRGLSLNSDELIESSWDHISSEVFPVKVTNLVDPEAEAEE
jgi:hypothetical protein